MALPPTIKTIVGLIGHAKAMDLIHELGGQEFRFPVGKRSPNWAYLVEIVGEKPAEVLVAHFKGTDLYIPYCKDALREDRNRLMIVRYEALLDEGYSGRAAVSILVQEFRPISSRRVEIIVNSPTPSAMPEIMVQGRLF